MKSKMKNQKKETTRLLRETLEFYANKHNYSSPSTGFAAQYDPEPSPIMKDNGERAYAALLAIQTNEL